MIPIFKTHFSIGKSILTIDKIFELGKDQKEIVLVEDSMSGFRAAKKKSFEVGIPLRFGLRLSTVDSGGDSKVIYFAENDKGVDSLRRIFTKAFTENNGIYKFNRDDLAGIKLAIPFYDSYIHKSLHHFGSYELDLRGLKPFFFSEDNNHPFDFIINAALKEQEENIIKCKSIFYEKREDAVAFQWYKATCGESKAGRRPTFERPELPHFCSEEFCWESYLENEL